MSPTRRRTSTNMALSKKQKQQLHDLGLCVDSDTGDIIKVGKPSKVVSIVKEGVEDGADLGKKVATKTGHGLSRAGEEVLYVAVDLPTEAVKATGRGIRRLARHMSETHQERLEEKRERRADRKARREAEKAEAEAKAEAIRDAAAG